LLVSYLHVAENQATDRTAETGSGLDSSGLYTRDRWLSVQCLSSLLKRATLVRQLSVRRVPCHSPNRGYLFHSWVDRLLPAPSIRPRITTDKGRSTSDMAHLSAVPSTDTPHNGGEPMVARK
jgi:hypothetical protein